MEPMHPTAFVDGRWVAAEGETFDVIEAATGQVLGRATAASPADVDAAVAVAVRAGAGAWSEFTAEERAATVERFAAALKVRGKVTARSVSRENGMPLAQSRIVNGFAPAEIVAYYARLVRESAGEDVRAGSAGPIFVERDPVGVVAAIVPWNYPQALAAMKVGPALAAGCTAVLKTASETALDAEEIGCAANEAGLPPGVLNIVTGGRESGELLVEHSGVDKVAFTGSTAAGRVIAERCGRLLRPVTLELGGKSAAIVAEDADLDLFSRNLLSTAFPNNGQTCYATSRVLAPRSRYRDVVDAVTSAASAMVVGDPLDKSTEIGPLVSAEHRDRVLGHIGRARDEGGRVTTGGRVCSKHRDGWFVEPTVFADVPGDAYLAQNEVFGPVVSITPYDGIDDAVRVANDSRYGLGGIVWTADPDRGREIARAVHTGTFGINTYSLDPNAPFGGVRDSGLGRELGSEGIEPYYQLKSIYTREPAHG